MPPSHFGTTANNRRGPSQISAGKARKDIPAPRRNNRLKNIIVQRCLDLAQKEPSLIGPCQLRSSGRKDHELLNPLLMDILPLENPDER